MTLARRHFLRVAGAAALAAPLLPRMSGAQTPVVGQPFAGKGLIVGRVRRSRPRRPRRHHDLDHTERSVPDPDFDRHGVSRHRARGLASDGRRDLSKTGYSDLRAVAGVARSPGYGPRGMRGQLAEFGQPAATSIVPQTTATSGMPNGRGVPLSWSSNQAGSTGGCRDRARGRGPG